jgi:ABC-type nickel/cobalt efflux system permease component RcnA
MDRLASAALNFATNFLLAFAVVGLLRNRSAGMKAGVAFGLLGGVGTWLLYDRLAEQSDGEGPSLDDLAVEPAA